MLSENVEEKSIKIIIAFIIGIIGLVIAIFARYIENTAISRYYSEYKNLYHTSIDNIVEKTSYILVDELFKTDVKDEFNNNYYIIYSDGYSYIVLMTENDYKTLTSMNYKKNHVRIIGVTKQTPNDLKSKLVNSYNQQYGNIQEDSIDISEYDAYFGPNYLNVISYDKKGIVSDNNITMTPHILFIIFLIISIISFTYIFIEWKKANENY